ncbi:Uncharacterised protein [Mycobacteroides abscessus subsp. massiliense]|nr:Uncharacterised protein [Mycobacteroides abscessus subsp. massiliense]
MLALGQHGEHDLGTGQHLGDLLHHGDARSLRRGQCVTREVETAHGVPGRHQIGGHRAAHVSQTDPAIGRHQTNLALGARPVGGIELM